MKNGVKAIIVCEDEILLFHRDNKPGCRYPLCWQIAGGGIDEGETPEEALVREVREEASYEVKNYALVEKTIGTEREDLYRYLIKVDKNEKHKFKIGPGEGLEVKFFTINEALKLELTPGTKSFLKNRRKEIQEWMK